MAHGHGSSGGRTQGPTEADFLSAFVGGDHAAIARVEKHTGSKIVGEVLENLVADVFSKGGTGFAPIAEVLERTGSWGRYGFQALSIAGATKIAEQFAQLAARHGADPKTVSMIRLYMDDLVEGIARGAINASDPAKRKKLLEDTAAKVASRMTNAFRDPYGFVHLKQLDVTTGSPAATDANGYPTACVTWQNIVTGWTVAHPTTTKTSGGGRGGHAGGSTVVSGLRVPFDEGDSEDLARGGGMFCPHCFGRSGGTGTVSAASLTFWQKVTADEAVREVLMAAVGYASRNANTVFTVDLLEDLERHCDFSALAVICRRIWPRLIAWQDAAGTIVRYEITAEDAKEFKTAIDSFGGAELKAHNKVAEAAHNAWEAAKHAYQHRTEHGDAAWKAVLLTAITFVMLPLGYLFVGLVLAAAFLLGVFYGFDDPRQNIACLLTGALGGFLWLIPWYSVEGISKVFGGFLHAEAGDHHEPSGFANMARNITALLCGVGAAVLLIVNMGLLFGFDTTIVRWMTIPVVVLALLGYNRIGSLWHADEEVHHLVQHLAIGNIRTLAFVATAMIAVGVGPFSYVAYVKENTVFRLAVERAMQGKEYVYYVPTPAGTLFNPSDILGPVKAREIETGMDADKNRAAVCLSEGYELSVPGYNVQPVEDSACEDGGMGYAFRSSLLGRAAQIGDGAPEYATLEDLAAARKAASSPPAPAATAPADSGPSAAVVATTAAPQVVQTAQVQSTHRQATPPKATAKRGVDCASLSERSRKRMGCQ